MVEQIVTEQHTKHTFRLVLTSLIGVIFFGFCLLMSLQVEDVPKGKTTIPLQKNTLQEPAHYNPPLSGDDLSQVSEHALPNLNTLIEGNMLPVKPAEADTAPRYVQNKVASPNFNGIKIAIVIDDMGVNVSESARVIAELPKAVTLSFLPYGDASLSQATQAHAEGHEIMVHIPMEALPNSEGYSPNPGDNALYTNLDADELYKRTLMNLTPFLDLAVGANNHMGSKMTSNAVALRPALRAVADNKMFFLDSLTTPKSAVKEAAKDLPLPLLTRHVFLDHYQDSVHIEAALDKTLEHALKTGRAIAIGHPYPETTAAISAWAKTLPSNVQIVPITHLLEE